MAFFSMARKSNLVVTNLSQPIKCLKRQDIMIGRNVLLFRFLWSKTNQFAKGYKVYLCWLLKGPPLCPVIVIDMGL